MCYVGGTAATPSVDTGTVACASGAGAGSISVDSTATQFTAARLSASQSCFVILDATTGTRYGETTAANCYADWATTVTVTATHPPLPAGRPRLPRLWVFPEGNPPNAFVFLKRNAEDVESRLQRVHQKARPI